MKKLSILAVAALFTFGLTSCKKDWNCTCTDSTTGTTPDVYPINDAKKKDAEKACDVWGALYTPFGGSCSLEKK